MPAADAIEKARRVERAAHAAAQLRVEQDTTGELEIGALAARGKPDFETRRTRRAGPRGRAPRGWGGDQHPPSRRERALATMRPRPPLGWDSGWVGGRRNRRTAPRGGHFSWARSRRAAIPPRLAQVPHRDSCVYLTSARGHLNAAG